MFAFAILHAFKSMVIEACRDYLIIAPGLFNDKLGWKENPFYRGQGTEKII